MPNFDSVARPYVFLERIVFGDTLQRARTAHLDLLSRIEPGNFLLAGEGDGRFLEQLVKAHPKSQFTVVDSSARMLDLIRRRLQQFPLQSRIQLFQSDVLAKDPHRGDPPRYDAIISHFFLDCFNTSEVATIAEKFTRRLAPGAPWIITDFQPPPDLHQKLLLKFMYLFFRHSAGLRVRKLPGYQPVLETHRLDLIANATFQNGLITSAAYSNLSAQT